jgi:tRNA A-37 threonylcarbamoyl transferase component Bud32
MTSTPKTCPRCGTAYDSASSPAGVCPSCLMENALPKRDESAPAATPRPTAEELAAAFPDYEFDEAIGWGGMGTVYRARQKKLDRTVAIKLLRPDLENDPAFAERFEREARALAKLEHPGVVRIYDFGESEHGFYLSMEYVDGANLRELLRDGKLTNRDALSFVPQICDALQFAHDRGVVHRDIKPENILVDQEGRVRIADFGLAKLIGSDHISIGLTGSSHTVGTPHYMAPEQVAGSSELDHRADIYSLGVVLYEMLTGDLPIGRFKPPSGKAGGDKFDEIVMRTLESEPENRFQNLSELKQALAEIPDSAPKASQAKSSSPRDARSASIGRLESSKKQLVYAWGVVAAVALGCTSQWGQGARQDLSWVQLKFGAWNTTYKFLGLVPIPGWFLLLLAIAIATSRSFRQAGFKVPGALAPACGGFGLVMSTHLFFVLLVYGEDLSFGLPIIILAYLSWVVFEVRLHYATRADNRRRAHARMRAARRRRFEG